MARLTTTHPTDTEIAEIERLPYCGSGPSCFQVYALCAAARDRNRLEAESTKLREAVIEECAQAAILNSFAWLGRPCCCHTRDDVEQAIVDAIRALKSQGPVPLSQLETNND